MDRRSTVAATFRDGRRGRLVHDEIVRRFELGAHEAGIAQLSLDGLELVLVAARIDVAQLPEITRVIEGLGGSIVAGATRTSDEDLAVAPAAGDLGSLPAAAG